MEIKQQWEQWNTNLKSNINILFFGGGQMLLANRKDTFTNGIFERSVCSVVRFQRKLGRFIFFSEFNINDDAVVHMNQSVIAMAMANGHRS